MSGARERLGKGMRKSGPGPGAADILNVTYVTPC